MNCDEWRDGWGGGGVQAFCGAGGVKNLGRSHQENERQALNYFSLCAQQMMSW